MSTEDKPKPAPAKPDDKKPVKKADVPAAPTKLPAFDERRLTFAELVPHALALVPDELIAMARDGRPLVRANAALALAVANHPAHDLVMLVRDSDLHVAQSAAAAIGKLGATARPLIPAATAALDGAQPDVVEAVITAWSELVGTADDELIAALDIPHALALKTIVPAMGKIGKRGIAFLVKAAGHERSRIRMNAIAGLGRLGKTDPETAMATLTQIEGNDSVPDIRTAAKQAMLEVVAREKVVVVDRLPKNIPDFEERKLSRSELLEYEAAIDIEEMIYALQDGRTHVKINAARCLAMKADKAGRGARSLGLLLRDSVGQVRREVALALGKVGPEAVDAGTDLVGALGDAEDDVVEAAIDTLAALGPSVQDALVRGLDASHEAHGVRVGDLIGRLPGGAGILADAFRSPAVNVQVHAALGMGLLRDRVGAGLALLHGARTGGDARTRDAVRRAIEMIDPKGDTGPQAVAIEDFEQRFLGAAELEKHKPALERVGVADLIAYVQLDGREVVRANAATALGLIGAAAAPAATSLGVRLRDDSARVRLASAQALDKLGDAAVVETAGDLVGALGDSDDKVAETCATVLVARKGRMVGALVRGLETDDPRHGQRIVEVLARLPDAPEILLDAFASPAVNVQVNSAIGLGMLGNDRVGKGRKALEGARTGGWERTREAVRKALDLLDGPRRSGPTTPDIEGFEQRVLAADAFKDPAKLSLPDLVAHLTDGRNVVRANSATAIGALGPAGASATQGIAVLLRDDDMRVRIAAAGALDKIGDDAVREIAAFLVGALRGDAEVAKAVAPVLAARKTRVLTALLKGLETDDEPQARRILELVNVLPDACETLCDAIESPAENVQVNAAIGIGMLGAKRAGSAGRKALETRRTGGFVRTREAAFKGLAMLKE